MFEAASNLDLARCAEDETIKRQALQLAEFLLPVCKACGSEAGFEVANLAVQVFGGHGYITESGVEQYVRDSRVAAIYEGSNGIQALDLVSCNLLRDQGARFQVLAEKISTSLAEINAMGSIEQIHLATQTGLAVLERTTKYILQMAMEEKRRDVEFIAKDYCLLAGLVAGAWMWLRIAHAAAKDERQDMLSYVNCARFYAEYLMPEMHTLTHRINMNFSELEVWRRSDQFLDCNCETGNAQRNTKHPFYQSDFHACQVQFRRYLFGLGHIVGRRNGQFFIYTSCH